MTVKGKRDFETDRSVRGQGARLRSLRKELGLTQQEFAAPLPIDRSTITNAETGRRQLGRSLVSLVASRYRVNERWLLTGEGPMRLPPEPETEGDVVRVPILGSVAAGGPFEFHGASPGGTQCLYLGKDLVGRSTVHALEVVGESMLQAGILPGDYVICKEGSAVRGDVVIAEIRTEMIPDLEYTLKRWLPRSDGKVELQPANESMESIVLPADRVIPRAIVVALFRRFDRQVGRPKLPAMSMEML